MNEQTKAVYEIVMSGGAAIQKVSSVDIDRAVEAIKQAGIEGEPTLIGNYNFIDFYFDIENCFVAAKFNYDSGEFDIYIEGMTVEEWQEQLSRAYAEANRIPAAADMVARLDEEMWAQMPADLSDTSHYDTEGWSKQAELEWEAE